MKITLSISEILRSVYANSALNAMALEAPGGIVAFVLSPAHENALYQMARDAFASTLALAGSEWQIEEPADSADSKVLIATCPNSLSASAYTLAEQLRTAVAAMMVHIIFAAARSPQASVALSTARALIANLAKRQHAIQSIMYNA